MQEFEQSPERRVESATAIKLPIYFKKKVLPLNECRALQASAKELSEENEWDVIHQKTMLEKIADKHNEFVERLEKKLEDYRRHRIREIKLKRDELPDWSLLTDSHAYGGDPNEPEALKRIREWHEVMEAYVRLQRDRVTKFIGSWFNQMDVIKNEGEKDAYVRKIEPTESSSKFGGGTSLIACGILVLVYIGYSFINVKPEDISECADKPGKCMQREIMKFLAFIHDKYLKFHNITLEDFNISALNSSRSDAEFE